MHPYRNPLDPQTSHARPLRACDPTLPGCFLVIGLSRVIEAMGNQRFGLDAGIGLVVALFSAMALAGAWRGRIRSC